MNAFELAEPPRCVEYDVPVQQLGLTLFTSSYFGSAIQTPSQTFLPKMVAEI
jgi:hypothetical protein